MKKNLAALFLPFLMAGATADGTLDVPKQNFAPGSWSGSSIPRKHSSYCAQRREAKKRNNIRKFNSK